MATLIDGIYSLKKQIGKGGMAAVYLAEVDLDRFDYTTLYAYTQVQGATHLERRRNAEELAAVLKTKNLDLATIRAVLEAQKIPIPNLEVAVKVAIGETDANRFAGEWKNLLCLNHPYVIQVYGGGIYQKRPYYSMELLRNLVSPKVISKTFSIEQKLTIIRQGAEGIKYLHDQGLIHRDIKPDNLPTFRIESGEYRTKVSDLGLGKNLGEDLGLTQSNTIMGSPVYMSPEQITATRNVDHRADIYSLGAALYELASGFKPYHNKTTVFEIISAVSRGEPPLPVKKHAPELPDAVCGIIECAMSRSPDQRYQSAHELAEDLTAYLKAESSEVTQSTSYKIVQDKVRKMDEKTEYHFLRMKAKTIASRRSQRSASPDILDPTVNRRVIAPVEKKQTKWLIPSLAAGIVLMVGIFFGIVLTAKNHTEEASSKETGPATQIVNSLPTMVEPVAATVPKTNPTEPPKRAIVATVTPFPPPPKQDETITPIAKKSPVLPSQLPKKDETPNLPDKSVIVNPSSKDASRPAWASAIGKDQYGSWADLTVAGVTQRFRWILPGTFTMGSPQFEKDLTIQVGAKSEWVEQEVQHEVTISKGYWLADSACTQKLWQAIMGSNPSKFTDDPQNPVEHVSWKDCQIFLSALNGQVNGGVFRLPTEAEWEYACRAGTKTAFSFGETIVPDQVNYNSKYPYGGAAKGLFRERTVAVKSFQPNAWGLYDMHGNVGQWCSDWAGDYSTGAVTDPSGLSYGSRRVIRGGGWNRNAWQCRSANRWMTVDVRLDFSGCRFVAQTTSSISSSERSPLTEKTKPENSTPKTPPSPWNNAGSKDQYGTWAELNVNGISQRFRWIVPGTFTMGSPQSEKDLAIQAGAKAEWVAPEVLHEVTITKGYWLADSECTQGLWQAITGSNPAKFQNPKNPVEQISWEDCQGFLSKLNSQVTGVRFRLPSEAEWEYACRAGTKTAFHFGATITPDQVNYDGNSPYGGAAKGLFREKTVAVKSFQPNAWGLHDMHGNVWEWCGDWYGDFPAGNVIDPIGAASGSLRVGRGGSWRRNAWVSRSAFRYGNAPGSRSDYLGFRICAQVQADR